MENSFQFPLQGFRAGILRGGRRGLIFQAVMVGALFAGCASGVDLTLDLIDPCKSTVLADAGCQYMRIVVSSLDPRDPLHCANSPGPMAWDCAFMSGGCSLSRDEFLGQARMVDVRCYVDREGGPVARATTQAMEFGTGGGGIGSTRMNLLIGNINGFVETTELAGSDQLEVGACSYLMQGRFGHTSVLLGDGKVLITGGIRKLGQVEEILTSQDIQVETFDPATGEHRNLPNKMRALSGRAYHTATRLSDGKVLLAGGVGKVEEKVTALQHAEIFDPASESFPIDRVSKIGNTPRAHHTATLLPSGEVLVVGGASYANGRISSYFDSAVVYNPQTNGWSEAVNTMSTGRAFHQAVSLGTSGKVVVIGGENALGPLNSIELYDAEGRQFYSGVNVTMAKNRSHHCAVLLNNGEVLVAGGRTGVDVASVDTGVEVYDPSDPPYGAFKALSLDLDVARMDHTCTLLQTGNVLVSGGLTGNGAGLQWGELVLIGSGTYSVQQLTDLIEPPRYLHTATRLGNGWVYLAGGLPSQAPEAQPISQSLLFVPPPACQ